jgi:NADPH:quinone reductase-like Zn-dependent oxidoreductase
MFQALLLEKSDTFTARVQPVDESALPAGDVTVRVDWSCLNYKDGLAITNKGPVVRQWPMVAGIDGAGTVLESSHPGWKAGDAFVHNGWGVGETTGAAWPRKPASRATGWSSCPPPSPPGRPWPSARRATPPCCVCWRWKTMA